MNQTITNYDLTHKTTRKNVMDSLTIACVIALAVWAVVMAGLGVMGVEMNIVKAFVFEALTIANTAVAVYVFKYR